MILLRKFVGSRIRIHRQRVPRSCIGGILRKVERNREQLRDEILFASDVHGPGLYWEATTRLNDTDAIELLRRIQAKMLGLRG